MSVPFFRPSITTADIDAVVACLRSGWLTTGPRTREFETAFAEFVGARHAVALNSCTAALHLSLVALGIRRGDMVLVPTLTFPATAEVVNYLGAVPVFVDCDPVTLCMDPQALRRTLEALTDNSPTAGLMPPYGKVRAVIPMHYGGQMADTGAIRALANEFQLAVIEDAAHALPAWYRDGNEQPWQPVGTTGDITCFSFYANKCITTGEGGMAVTDRDDWAGHIRLASLHGISRDPWDRHTRPGMRDYQVIAPGYKYNLTDIAATMGITQLAKANDHYHARQRIARRYLSSLEDIALIELPVEIEDRKSAWHLFAIRLRKGCWRIDRNRFVTELQSRGIETSVHWRPLHTHAYYRDTFGFGDGLFPNAEEIWPRLVSLPIFPGMTDSDIDEVTDAIHDVAARYGCAETAVPGERSARA